MSSHGGGRKHVSIGYEDEDAPAKVAAPSIEMEEEAELAGRGMLPSEHLIGVKQPDNAALAVGNIKTGATIMVSGKVVVESCPHDIPDGHRFAICDLPKGAILTSWGLKFGVALRDLKAGDYLCNEKSLNEFNSRKIGNSNMPPEPSFENSPFETFRIDEEQFEPCPTKIVDFAGVPDGTPQTFMGYPRPGDRGSGTRNYVVVLGVTSKVSGFARGIERRFTKDDVKKAFPNCDGVVAVAHTEGGVERSNVTAVRGNHTKVLRVLSGFAVHPNVGGILFVEQGHEELRTEHVLDYMQANGYPLDHVPYKTMTLSGRQSEDGLAAQGHIQELLLAADKAGTRVETPMSELKLAQQCGGSDAFSGLSANPLMGWVARRLVALSGGVILAETDELIGAENYVLDKVRDAETANKFLQLIDRYYRYTRRFGHSPEGNPSGGNLFRGLYNITLKSAGAAMKKPPDVRLEHVLEYGEQARRKQDHGSGYCFMDSPGNDLESISGQVAAGCNIVCFTTGNGAITNHPFVPTVKVLTTTQRYNLLSEDMDINAGSYVDGTRSMDQLGESTFEYIASIASGTASRGERAGHHQVQIWRDWLRVTGDDDDASERPVAGDVSADPGPTINNSYTDENHPDAQRSGVALKLAAAAGSDGALPKPLQGTPLLMFPKTWNNAATFATSRIGMICPTSLCSSHVAVMLAERLTKDLCPPGSQAAQSLSSIVALPHTEGCGRSSGVSEDMYIRTILGYASHPMVACAVMLEHGCEKTHNDKMAGELTIMGEDKSKWGYVSIQLDGGIEKAYVKIKAYFEEFLKAPLVPRTQAPLGALRVGIVATLAVPDEVSKILGHVAAAIARAGGTVVAAGQVGGSSFLHELLADGADGQNDTLGYGQRAKTAGLHRMHSITQNMTELLTGIGGTGVEIIIAYVGDRSVESHPMLPVLQVGIARADGAADDGIDVVLESGSEADLNVHRDHVLEQIVHVANRSTGSGPKLFGSEFVNFQITRGSTAVSL